MYMYQGICTCVCIQTGPLNLDGLLLPEDLNPKPKPLNLDGLLLPEDLNPKPKPLNLDGLLLPEDLNPKPKPLNLDGLLLHEDLERKDLVRARRLLVAKCLRCLPIDMYICMYIHIHIHTNIHRERERATTACCRASPLSSCRHSYTYT
jgi:hypothetical protein